VDPRASLDDMKGTKFLTLSELELRPLLRPARSQSLSRLHSVQCRLVKQVKGRDRENSLFLTPCHVSPLCRTGPVVKVCIKIDK
jgi:hypothetical protein